MKTIKIYKAKHIRGRSLILRDASVSDAIFITTLRMDQKKARYISKSSNEIRSQEEWLRDYESCGDQAYFIIENLRGVPLGTIRLYGAKVDSFSWGSWIIKDDAPASSAIESALIIYSYALNSLGFSNSHFQVHKSNERVWKFHERFGAIRVSEDAIECKYIILKDAIISSMKKYRRYLPEDIVLERFNP